jgi:hypothetical protein
MTKGRVGEDLQLGEDCFDEVLGLGAGDEDGGRDAQRQAVELLLAGDVLDGLVGQASRDCRLVCGLLFGCELTIRIDVELRAGDAERVQQQRERIAGGCLTQIGRGFKLRGGAGEDGRESCQLSVLSCQALVAA